MAERRGPGAAEALVFLAVLAAFWPALSFPFLRWDDWQNVVDNGWLRFDGPGLLWMASGSRIGHWQPLTWLSFALDRALWGERPLGFHLTNVLLHAANAVLLFRLARRLLPGGKSGPVLPAVVAALLWGLHPLRAESVAWVTERRDVLCGLLCLLSALAVVRAHDEPAKASSWRLAAVAAACAAMSAKVFAVVLPGALFLLERRLGENPRAERWAPCVPFAAAALWFNVGAQADSGASVPLAAFGLSSRLAQACLNLAYYPLKTVLPVGLAPFYELSPTLEPRPFALSLCAVSVAAVFLWLGRKRKGLIDGAAAYVLLLLPALGLFKSGRMVLADRWSYLPAIPLSLLLAAAFGRAVSGAPARAAAVALGAGLFVLTRLQLPVYSSDRALWESGSDASPLSSFALERLAEAQDREGLPDAAVTRARAAALKRFVLGSAADAADAQGDHERAEGLRRRAEAP